jgi:hypothetical protein
MKLKSLNHFTVDPNGKIGQYSAVLIGISMFVRVLHYYLFRELASCSAAEATFSLILPLVFSVAWLLIIRVIPLRQPLVFGGISTLMLLTLAVEGFFIESTLFAVLGLLWYLISAAAVTVAILGILPRRILIFAACTIPAILWGVVAVVMYVFSGNFWQGLLDYAVILQLCSMALFAGMLKPIR